jgi:hypothetical protein
MRLNLSVKFFIAFLATAFTIVIVMVVTMQYYLNSRQNFNKDRAKNIIDQG